MCNQPPFSAETMSAESRTASKTVSDTGPRIATVLKAWTTESPATWSRASSTRRSGSGTSEPTSGGSPSTARRAMSSSSSRRNSALPPVRSPRPSAITGRRAASTPGRTAETSSAIASGAIGSSATCRVLSSSHSHSSQEGTGSVDRAVATSFALDPETSRWSRSDVRAGLAGHLPTRQRLLQLGEQIVGGSCRRGDDRYELSVVGVCRLTGEHLDVLRKRNVIGPGRRDLSGT